MRVERAVDAYLRHVTIERGLSDHTVAAYRRDLAGYVSWLGERDVTDAAAVTPGLVAEFVAGSGKVQGLAWRILDAGYRLQTARMFAALFVLGLMGALLYALLQWAERAALRWWRGG